MPEIKTFNNSHCLRCNVVEPVMVRIGALVMCRTCAVEVFPITDNNGEVDYTKYCEWYDFYTKKY